MKKFRKVRIASANFKGLRFSIPSKSTVVHLMSLTIIILASIVSSAPVEKDEEKIYNSTFVNNSTNITTTIKISRPATSILKLSTRKSKSSKRNILPSPSDYLLNAYYGEDSRAENSNLTSAEYQRLKRQLYREDIPHHRPLSGDVYAQHYGHPHPGRWTGRDFEDGPMTNNVHHSDDIHQHNQHGVAYEEHIGLYPLHLEHQNQQHHQNNHQNHHQQQQHRPHHIQQNHHHHQEHNLQDIGHHGGGGDFNEAIVHEYPTEYGHELNVNEGHGIKGLLGVEKEVHHHVQGGHHGHGPPEYNHHHIPQQQFVVNSDIKVSEPHGHSHGIGHDHGHGNGHGDYGPPVIKGVVVHQEHHQELPHHNHGHNSHFKPIPFPIPVPIPAFHFQPTKYKRPKRPKYNFVYHHRHPHFGIGKHPFVFHKKPYWPKYGGSLGGLRGSAFGGLKGFKGSFLWYTDT